MNTYKKSKNIFVRKGSAAIKNRDKRVRKIIDEQKSIKKRVKYHR